MGGGVQEAEGPLDYRFGTITFGVPDLLCTLFSGGVPHFKEKGIAATADYMDVQGDLSEVRHRIIEAFKKLWFLRPSSLYFDGAVPERILSKLPSSHRNDLV